MATVTVEMAADWEWTIYAADTSAAQALASGRGGGRAALDVRTPTSAVFFTGAGAACSCVVVPDGQYIVYRANMMGAWKFEKI